MKYEVNDETLAVIGIDVSNSKIIEKEKEYEINDNIYNIMDDSCQYFGSSYSGRVAGSKKMLDSKYKLPIVVEESSNLIFFPLNSPENDNCVWISLKWFDSVIDIDNKTYIIFKNGTKIDTNVSKYSIKNQVLRASRLNIILNERKI